MDAGTSLLPTKAVSIIEEVLRRSGLSQAELARRAGIQRSVLNAYLRGHRKPGADALVRLCRAAGFELRPTPVSSPVDSERAERLLIQVLELSEALPFHRREKLEYPHLPVVTAQQKDR